MEPAPASENELEERLSRPTAGVLDAVRELSGDVIVLGAGGKMGPSLTLMLRRALDECGTRSRVIAVSRFADNHVRERLRSKGVDTVACDLSDASALESLPDAPSIIYMAGQKFGTARAPASTWGANVVIPSLVAERFRKRRIVAFSTGNVYSLTPVDEGGSRETDEPAPIGEYGMSCLGRERVFEYYALRDGSPLALVRLNYAIDLRYGVLVDLARRILSGTVIDLRMGFVNVIWQGDANAQAIQCLSYATSPPFVVNITGEEVLSVREAAEQLGRHLGRAPTFIGEPDTQALLSNATLARELFGAPTVSTMQLIAWVAEWLSHGGRTLDKPTHFETRDGAF